jgi:hypothetical protein
LYLGHSRFTSEQTDLEFSVWRDNSKVKSQWSKVKRLALEIGATTGTDSSDMFVTPDRQLVIAHHDRQPADRAKLSISHCAAEILDDQASLRTPCPPDLCRRF